MEKRFKVLNILFVGLASFGLGVYYNKIDKIEFIFKEFLDNKNDTTLSILDFNLLKLLGFVTFFALIFMYYKIVKKK